MTTTALQNSEIGERTTFAYEIQRNCGSTSGGLFASSSAILGSKNGSDTVESDKDEKNQRNKKILTAPNGTAVFVTKLTNACKS